MLINLNSAEIILYLSLFGVCYSYFLYPLILLILPKSNKRTNSPGSYDGSSLPYITFIITAYNEESGIVEKIMNTLKTDYPADKREILVASDGSTDKTNKLVCDYTENGVKLIEVLDRKGKENAQLAAIHQARGEILVFSDVSTRIDENALHIIANVFSNPKVGAISSEDRFLTANGEIAGEGVYVKYEMWLRKLESSVYSLVGLSGSFFAARKEICLEWNIMVPSDFNTALNSVKNGRVAVSVPELHGYYPNIKDDSKEYQRKLRTVIRGMAAIAQNPLVLNPFKLGFFAFEIISHKIMRWLVPWFMITLLISNIILWQAHLLYTALLIGQFAFYFASLIGWAIKSTRTHYLIKIPFFFMQVNTAITHASLQFISGKRITRWEPSKR